MSTIPVSSDDPIRVLNEAISVPQTMETDTGMELHVCEWKPQVIGGKELSVEIKAVVCMDETQFELLKKLEQGK